MRLKLNTIKLRNFFLNFRLLFLCFGCLLCNLQVFFDFAWAEKQDVYELRIYAGVDHEHFESLEKDFSGKPHDFQRTKPFESVRYIKVGSKEIPLKVTFYPFDSTSENADELRAKRRTKYLFDGEIQLLKNDQIQEIYLPPQSEKERLSGTNRS